MTPPHASPIPVRLILPMPAGDGATCLLVDAEGRIRDRRTLDPRQPLATTTDMARNVLALPGSEVRSLWLELPARSEAQAVAAARLMLDDRSMLVDPPGNAGNDLHMVVAPKTGDTNERQVLIVESATLQARLDQARQLGIEADVALPDYMLLPAGSPDTPPCVAARDGQWMVRGHRLAFACEPELAAAVLDGAVSTPIDAVPDDIAAVEAQLVDGALRPPLSLLQQRFARHGEHPEGWQAWRRAAVLAGLLLLSPLLLTAADAARYAVAAMGLRTEARDIARELAGASANDDAPAIVLQDALMRENATDAFPRLGSALFGAAAGISGMQLEQLDYQGGDSLQATLSLDTPSHGTTDMLEELRQRLAGDGLQLETGDSKDAAGRRISTVVVTSGASMDADTMEAR